MEQVPPGGGAEPDAQAGNDQPGGVRRRCGSGVGLCSGQGSGEHR